MPKHTNTTAAELTVRANLTPRQQQILELMQQGKVNKEIANELNISLGTVKQHLVAVFKKLNVQNRTMAVARLAEFKDQSGFDAVFAQETLIARRPAIILSLKVANNLPLEAMRLFNSYMAEMAFDSQALFISREQGDGDLIFGLKRSSAQDIRMAIQVAERVFKAMRRFVAEQLQPANPDLVLTGALVAGLIDVSQNRFGGWSGETVGSHLLTLAHKIRDLAATGHLAFDTAATLVMQAFDLTTPSHSSGQLLFAELHSLNRWNAPSDLPLIGRDSEYQYLLNLLAEDYPVLLLEGENGMGKSRLCREAARLALKEGHALFYINLLPSGFFDSQQYPHLKGLGQVIADVKLANKSLLILDDAHHLTLNDKTLLVDFLNDLPAGIQVIVCGRQPQNYAIKETLYPIYKRLHLHRLDEEASMALIKQLANNLTNQTTADILEQARGIPLFAKELLKATDNEFISLTLMITIASRIDKFKVDWKLLYCIASHNQPVSLKDLSELMQDDLAYITTALEHAETLGVLTYQAGLAAFRHPLVKKTISYLFQPTPTVNTIK